MEDPNVSGEQTSDAAGPVANEPSESTQADVQQEEQKVPLGALQAERADRQRLQDELKMMREHLTLVQAQQHTQNKPEEQKGYLDGLSDDDVLTVGDAKKIIDRMDNSYQMNIQELRMTQKYPDYNQVVTKYLPEIFKQNPSLVQSLEKSQDYELAYYLAKNSDAFKAENRQKKKNADAERIVQNANRAGSLSSVGQNSPVSTAKRYKEMSDSDFQKQVHKNLGYIA